MSARVHCPQIVALLVAFAIAAAAGEIWSLRAAQDAQVRVLFHGYVERQPRAALAIIDGNRISDLIDISFLPAGGEISPDGTRIAFDTCKKSDRGINVASVDGSDVKRLVPVAGDSCVDIRWSPDGTRLSYGNPLDRQLHIVEIDSGTDTQLPYTSPAYSWHSWSPAGDAIVYETGRGGSRRIDIIDLATWKTRQLVGKEQFGSCEVWAPDWSPTADRIVFTSCNKELYAVTVDGTGLTRLAESAYAPRWSPDGASVLFLNGSRLMRVPSSGGVARQIGVSPYYGGPFSIGPMR